MMCMVVTDVLLFPPAGLEMHQADADVKVSGMATRETHNSECLCIAFSWIIDGL